MTTPAPAELNITISRESGFQQDLELRCDGGGSAQHLRGYRFAAQLWSLDRSERYLSLEVPPLWTPGGRLRLLLSQAVAQGIVDDLNTVSGGDAAETGAAPELGGGDAATVFSDEPLCGGGAWIGVLPDVSRWDLLQVNPSHQQLILLRGIATLVD
jgi:hypothetical protein